MIRTTASFVRGTALALLICLAPVHSADARRSAPPEASAQNLKPGQYVWHADRVRASGPVEMFVSLGAQKAWVFQSGELVGVATISSGKKGHESPVGVFPILQKRKDHRSNRYNNAPMPFMQRLNWHGVALHGGQIPGHPASMGCIRLPMKFAERLYGVTTLGSLVYIADEVPASPEAALAMLRAAVPAANAS